MLNTATTKGKTQTQHPKDWDMAAKGERPNYSTLKAIFTFYKINKL
jgi:hypothetical protein